MKEHAGIDVSLEYSSVCVVDVDGRIVRGAKILSEPDALIAWFGEHAGRWSELAWRPAPCRSGSMPGG
ncbi:hypothetical protein [Sinorhizobium meliloti]|uniref:hypothetical protein n=1 Tax=Rhizobium meliloti TaxID=382 RepID=UPI000474E080